MNLRRLTAVVVGAGVAGSAVALLLARRGAEVLLLDKDPVPTAGGAGLALAPNGLAVLYGLGLESALRTSGTIATAMPVYGRHGRVLMPNRVPDHLGEPAHVLLIRRSHLIEALHTAIAGHNRITVRLGARVVDAMPGGRVQLVDDEWLEADLVVGADGTQSAVRRVAGIPHRTRGTRRSYVRAVGPRLEGHVSAEYWSPTGIFGTADVGDGTYLYASAHPPAISRALDRSDGKQLRTLWAGAHPHAETLLDGLDLPSGLIRDEVVEVRCAALFRGRVALVGDSAHAMAPNAGQGANSALVDAAVLADELERAGTIHRAFAAYERRRHRPVRRVQAMSNRLAWLADRSGPMGGTGRDFLLRAVGQRPATDRRAALLLWQHPLDTLAIIAAQTEP